MRVRETQGASLNIRCRPLLSFLPPLSDFHLLPYWAKSRGVKQGSVTDLIAGAILQAARFARGERRKIERRRQSGQELLILKRTRTDEGHPAGASADVEERNDGPRINVSRPIPGNRPFARVAEA